MTMERHPPSRLPAPVPSSAGRLLASIIAASLGGLVAAQGLVLTYRLPQAGATPPLTTTFSISMGESGLSCLQREATGKERRIEIEERGDSLVARFGYPGDPHAFLVRHARGSGQLSVVKLNDLDRRWQPGIDDGAAALYLLLPRLLDPRSPGSRKTYTISRGDGSHGLSVNVAAEGLRELEFGGKRTLAWSVMMEPADPLLRLLRPGSWRFYFRVEDLVMVRHERPGPRNVELIASRGNLQ